MEYYIVNMFTEGMCDKFEAIAIYDSYQEADDNYDRFCNVYPHGWLEILSAEEYISCK